MFELSWRGVWIPQEFDWLLMICITPAHHRTTKQTFNLQAEWVVSLCQSDRKGNAVEEIVINKEKREARGKSRGYFYFL